LKNIRKDENRTALLKKLEQQIQEAGGEAFPIEADLTSAEEAATPCRIGFNFELVNYDSNELKTTESPDKVELS
jgi:hypothetical protein